MDMQLLRKHRVNNGQEDFASTTNAIVAVIIETVSGSQQKNESERLQKVISSWKFETTNCNLNHSPSFNTSAHSAHRRHNRSDFKDIVMDIHNAGVRKRHIQANIRNTLDLCVIK
ncbi:hypothetical protein PsorP6_006530 [Peronosclerospora sorghi]|uniref:Uncharacterized protein n=1 Tax=Peronosclerospora sorghi TaxID=230839 RepID=A0ACC0W293_9STRA|nr:hypothetical protein PsorP6_006530 [Peronosclerospora sorghi]